ncbi:uncharacterized protein LOC109727910 [Ananas comosus]|uniref:Uncharacterized protein LOC109727910 n=2 Tax=Ananas comosus TaxID=4615 RepID=A0A6P5H105_ANACO|nr:uncharacterized protein LOC109727910 [Ananas comosus]
MEGTKRVSLISALVAAQLLHALALPITAPAFLWSPHNHGFSDDGTKEVVHYHTISPKDLAKSVFDEGGWSKLLCSGENLHESVDVALVFVGKELQSSDLSKSKEVDSALVNLLKLSFTSSNFSMAFPYVAISDEEATLENSLVSGFTENCGNGLGVNRVAYVDSCSISGENLQKLNDFRAVKDFMGSRIETSAGKLTDLIVFCNGGSKETDNTKSEGEILSELVSSLEQAGAKYAVLYASEPHNFLHFPSHLGLSRFLAEGSTHNGSSNSTKCDVVCLFKSTLLEGIFVGIVLLIILISGLCCMVGIETPTRFEAPAES